MKVRCIHLALVCITLVSGLRAQSTGDEKPDIRVHPEIIELVGPYAYEQVVITLTRPDGSQHDITREVTLRDCPLVAIDEHLMVTPRAEGRDRLVFTHNDFTFEAKLHVRNLKQPASPDFVRDVMPILSSRGCNTGSCHGSAKGQNGFRFSLRGWDPRFDHLSLTDDLAGRRFDRSAPAKSLFLLKPTGEVPHKGGQKMLPTDSDYQVLRRWVGDGVKHDTESSRAVSISLFPSNPTIQTAGASQQFKVVAKYQDGTLRDVTAHAFVEVGDIEVCEVHGTLVTALRRGDTAILARYEGAYAATRLLVMGDRSGFQWRETPTHNYIDELIYARLEEIKTQPSELCSDSEFVRRLYLDLCGLLPSPKDVTTFTADKRPSQKKRNELIDRLIGSTEFIEHWTNRWADLLQVNETFLGHEGAVALRNWIAGEVASNTPYDEFVRSLLTASGSTLKNPPASYFKILREPDAVMENTTQLFLGVRFNCNKCHDHPFERWTKKQHWQMAAMFADVERKNAPNSKVMPRRQVMKKGEKPPAYEELIGDGKDRDVVDPDGRHYGPALPYQHEGEVGTKTTRRQQLANWLTHPTNQFFATSYVNRLWSYLLGRGLIDPVDDIRASNPATFPKLLDRLTKEFVANGFDMRQTLRRICQSRTYQHSIRTNTWNQDNQIHYAHALARRLPAEVLYDAIHVAMGSRSNLPGVRIGTKARELIDSSTKVNDGFLDLFGRPPRESACECERSTGMSLGQALNLVNGPTFANAIANPDSDVARLVAFEKEPEAIIRELYLRFLGRQPTAAEQLQTLPLFDVYDLANVDALSAADANRLVERRKKWESGITLSVWQPLELGRLESTGGAVLTAQEDGSILASGASPATDDVRIVAYTEANKITGIRLEALPHESLPGKGPGRNKTGNFVLATLAVSAISRVDPSQSAKVKLTSPTADFSQRDWPVAKSIDASDKGWAVSPRYGVRHVAVYETVGDVGLEGGSMLAFSLRQPYGTEHTLGRFRLSVTTSPRPIRHHGLSEAVVQALATKVEERSEQQLQQIHRQFMTTDAELRDKLKLGATHDLCWALACSSAFLFNR